MQNNKGQMGETLTWVIATIIIVVILMFFIFGASLLGTTKNVTSYKNNLFSDSEYTSESVFLQKSIYTYLATDTDFLKKKIELDLKQKDDSSFGARLTTIRGRQNKK